MSLTQRQKRTIARMRALKKTDREIEDYIIKCKEGEKNGS